MKVRVLQHVPFEGLGCIESWLVSKGAEVYFTRFFKSDALPSVWNEDLVIVLGGPMSVNDEAQLPWLMDEKKWIRQAIKKGKSVLGICLGAQLISTALGGRVYPATEREIGCFPVFGIKGEGKGFCFPESLEVLHWHGETFDLPPGAVHLAFSAACKNQAFCLGSRVFGIQFHLEASVETVDLMLQNASKNLLPGRFVQSAEEIQSKVVRHSAAMNAWMERVLNSMCPVN